MGATTLVLYIQTEKKHLLANKLSDNRIKQNISCDSSNDHQCHNYQREDSDLEKHCTFQHDNSTSSYVMHAQVIFIERFYNFFCLTKYSIKALIKTIKIIFLFYLLLFQELSIFTNFLNNFIS